MISPCLSSITSTNCQAAIKLSCVSVSNKQNPVHNLQHRFHSAKDIVVQKPGSVCKILRETGAREKVGH